MSDALKLAADPRTEFGKGASRRARAAGQIPAVLYGHGAAPVHVLLPGHQTMMALKHANALLTIVVGNDESMAIAKDVQRDPVRQIIEHVDLLIVRKGEKLTVDVPLHIVGDSISGTIVMLEHSTLSILAEATHLPEGIEVSVEGLADGDKIHAGQVTLPAGSELVTDPEVIIIAITHPRASAADEAADAAIAAEASEASAAAAEASATAAASEAAEAATSE
jgi:large subunit ribosomal protein L25